MISTGSFSGTCSGILIQISEVGLGTWQLGSDWGDVDDKTAMETFAAAVESGVNFFDTAMSTVSVKAKAI